MVQDVQQSEAGVLLLLRDCLSIFHRCQSAIVQREINRVERNMQLFLLVDVALQVETGYPETRNPETP